MLTTIQFRIIRPCSFHRRKEKFIYNFKQIECEDVDFIQLAHYRDKWQSSEHGNGASLRLRISSF